MKRIVPGPGQESVWDYPRPPRLEPAPLPVRVEFAGQVIAASASALRLLETSHPPVYYIPQSDIQLEFLELASGTSSFCEFKGRAVYWNLVAGDRRSASAAWSYPNAGPRYADLNDHLAFYATRVDACYVGDELVQPQPGDFYGGWITSAVVGPFKGGPGTWGW